MRKILEVYDELKLDTKHFQGSVWNKVNGFVQKLSEKYVIDEPECVKEKKSLDKNKLLREQTNDTLEFESIVTISTYLDKNKEGVNQIIEYLEDSEAFGVAYKRNLENLRDDIQDLKDKCMKASKKKKDREDLIDTFVSKYLRLLKENFFETIYDDLYRYSLANGNNDDLRAFKEVIDQFMDNAGFAKQRVVVGEKINTKICGNSENPVRTDDPMLHKTIKDIIWEPYVLTYYSQNEGKITKKIIKGKVVCYSTKLSS